MNGLLDTKKFKNIIVSQMSEKLWNQQNFKERDQFIWESLNANIEDYIFDYFDKAYLLILNEVVNYNQINTNFSYQQLLQILDAAIKYSELTVFE
jgi:hypothetical protein